MWVYQWPGLQVWNGFSFNPEHSILQEILTITFQTAQISNSAFSVESTASYPSILDLYVPIRFGADGDDGHGDGANSNTGDNACNMAMVMVMVMVMVPKTLSQVCWICQLQCHSVNSLKLSIGQSFHKLRGTLAQGFLWICYTSPILALLSMALKQTLKQALKYSQSDSQPDF